MEPCVDITISAAAEVTAGVLTSTAAAGALVSSGVSNAGEMDCTVLLLRCQRPLGFGVRSQEAIGKRHASLGVVSRYFLTVTIRNDVPGLS